MAITTAYMAKVNNLEEMLNRRTAAHRPSLDIRRVNNRDAGAVGGQAGEVLGVERQEMCYAVSMADGDQAGVVDLFANDVHGFDQCLPRWENIGRVGEQRKERFKPGRFRYCIFRGQSKPVDRQRARGDAAEFDQVLRSDMQRLPASMQFDDRRIRHGVRGVRRIGQPHQDACVHQTGH